MQCSRQYAEKAITDNRQIVDNHLGVGRVFNKSSPNNPASYEPPHLIRCFNGIVNIPAARIC